MVHEVYYEFHENLEQLRRHGARGGKATARHRRERLEGGAAEERKLEAAQQVAIETTAAAIARLDQQCPWLRGAEKRFSNPSRPDV